MVKRPSDAEIASLPPALQERAFDPYTRQFLGENHFGYISSDEVKEALETYRQVSFLFEDARLALAVALHRTKSPFKEKQPPTNADTRDA